MSEAGAKKVDATPDRTTKLHHMRNAKYIVSFCFAVTSTLTLAQYRPDWTAQVFYQELNACRTSVVLPAIKDYESRGQSSGQSTEQLRGELVSMTPVFEAVASSTCYCALNELAKDVTYASYKADQAKIAGYIQVQKCKDSMGQIMRSMNRDRMLELRLK